MEQTISPAKKKGKAGLIIGLIAGILVVLGIVAAVLFFTVFNKLDVMKYISVQYDGEYEGRTYAVVVVDYVELAKELEFEEIKDIKNFQKLEAEGEISFEQLISSKDALKEIEEEYDLDLDELYDLGKALKISVKNGEDALSNGDVVKVTVKVKESADFKKKLVGGELEHEVKGLKEIKTLELEITPKFYGIDGDGRVEFFLDLEAYPWAAELGYSIYSDKSNWLSNGDEINVGIDFYNLDAWTRLAEENGYQLKESYTSTLSVAGLSDPFSASSFDQTTLEKYAQSIITNEASDFPVLPYEILAAYFIEDVDYADYNLRRSDYLVISFGFTDETGKVFNHVRAYRNPCFDADGKASYTSPRDHILSGSGWNNEQILNYVNIFMDSSDVLHTLPYVAADNSTEQLPADQPAN